MGSLAHCLRLAGLSKHENAILKGNALELEYEDLTEHQAAVKAVENYIRDLEAERASIVKQIEAAGGVVPQQKSDKPMASVPLRAVDQTKTEAFKKWSNNAPLVRSSESGTYEFKSGQRVVVEAFHGTTRPDRVGEVFKSSRATSGPMPFFSANPSVASGYAGGTSGGGKRDTSLSYEDANYGNWFKFKPAGARSTVDITRAWYSLPSETKKKIAEIAPTLRFDDDRENVIAVEGNDSGNGSYDHELSVTQRGYDKAGNPLKALVEDWLNSGVLFDAEEKFMDVLKKVGVPMDQVTFDSPNAEYPFVYKAYIAMQSPLVTSDVPESVKTALNDAAKRDRTRPAPGGADAWDKSTRTMRSWVEEFNKPDNAYVWTSIPDKVTNVLRGLGYDGIVDLGGKGGGESHIVYIPFNETQVKSAIGNKGKFDAAKKNIMYSLPGVAERVTQDQGAYRLGSLGASLVPGAKFATVAEPAQTGSIRVSGGAITSDQQAASALASLRKSPQERFVVLVLDQEKKPIAALKLFMGATSEALVRPEVVTKAVYEIPGAAHVWYAHNHPGGSPKPSASDIQLTRQLSESFGAGTGVEVDGHVVIAGSMARVMDASGNPVGGAFTIKPVARGATVPVMERTFRKAGVLSDPVNTPSEAVAVIPKVADGKTGIIFANSQNSPTGFLPFSAEQMRRLRDDGTPSGARILFGAAARANATKAFINFDGAADNRAVSNIVSALEGRGIRVLDVVHRKLDRTLAMSESGFDTRDHASTFLSAGTGKTGETPDSIRAAITKRFGRGVKALEDGGVLKIVKSASDLPARLLGETEADAVYDPTNKIAYLIADRLTPEVAPAKVLHELGEHYGLETMLGDKGWASLAARVSEMAQKDGSRAQAIWSAIKENYAEFRGRDDADLVSDARFMHEVIAHLGEAQAFRQSSVWRDLVTKVKLFLMKLGFGSISEADVGVILEGSVRRAMREQEGRLEAFSGDMQDQASFLAAEAKKRDFSDVDQFAAEDFAGFMEAAEKWRDTHAMASAAQTKTPAFKRWFGDSKVVDKDGNPLVVYHGTPDTRFVDDTGVFQTSTERLLHKDDARRAFFFTTDTRVARTYADPRRAFDYQNSEPGVIPAYLSLQNPMVFDVGGEHWRKNKHFNGTADAVAKAKAAGHDGLILRNVVDDYNTSKRSKQTDVFVAFHPTQIKSAVGNAGTFDPNNPNILLSNPAPTFYSELARQVDRAPMKQAPAGAWLQYINALKSKGVKPDEIAWSGVEDFLKLQEGKVSKEQVLEFLRGNGVQVEETVLGGNGDLAELEARLRALGWSTERSPDGNHVAFAEIANPDDLMSAEDIELDGQSGDAVVELANQIEQLYAGGSADTKYGQYQLPGGENYRELLLTLPEKERPYVGWELIDPEDGRVYMRSEDEQFIRKESARRGGWEIRPVRGEVADGKGNFVSPHFDQPNILAHVRFNERESVTYSDEDRAAFARRAEIEAQIKALDARVKKAQQERHKDESAKLERIKEEVRAEIAAGRVPEAGIVRAVEDRFVALPKTALDARVKELLAERRALQDSMPPEPAGERKRVLFIEEIQSDWAGKGRREGFAAGLDREAERDRRIAEAQARGATPAELRAIEMDAVRKTDTVPSAPFVTKTEAWVGLALKRMIRFASENGFDAISWTTGEQQAERYDLSKHIAEVRLLSRRPDAPFMNLVALTHNGGGPAIDRSVTKDDLADYVGKDVAQKLLDMPWGRDETIAPRDTHVKRLSGLDLKVGGEGMRAFYDSIVPGVARDVLKKLGGGRVGTTSFGVRFKVKQERDGSWSFEDEGGGGESGFQSREAAQKAADAYNGAESTATNIGTQPGFTITPELRARALQGLPLFSRSTRIRMTIADLIAAAESQASWKDWYKMHREAVERLFGDDAELFQKLLSATSQMQTVKGNVTMALKAYEQMLSGKEFEGYLGAVKKNLDRIRDGRSTEGVKINQFERANLGDESAAAVDRHVAMVLFGTSKPSPKQVAAAIDRIWTVAKRMRWTTRQVQAALWAFNQVKQGKVAEEVQSYDKILEARADEIAGIRSRYGRGEGGGVSPGGGTRADTAARSGSARGDQGSPQYSVPLTQAWTVPEPGRMDAVIRTLQDRHIDTKRVLKSIRDFGGTVPEFADVYLQEELLHGRAAKAVQDFVSKELKPLVEDMAMRGISMQEFEEYLHNRHAEERNRHIATINKGMPDGGSGIDTADARAYLKGLPDAKRKAFEALAKRVDAINGGTRSMIVSYGLEDQSTVDAWEGAYQNYVPLHREDMDEGHGLGTGQGISIRGPASKRATGSRRAVVDVLANIALQRERTIARGEKNRVANALVGLAMMNPNQDFWKVDEPPKISYVDQRTNQVVRATDPMFKSHDNVIIARTPSGGKIVEHAVIFNRSDPRAMAMATALKNLDLDEVGHVLGAVAKATRFFASMNTQYNPIFGVVNLIRDTQGAAFNLSSTALSGKQREVGRHVASALRGIYIDARAERAGKTASSAWAQLWEEFQNEGGQTGYRDMFRTSQDRAEAIRDELKRVSEGKAKRFGRAVFDWLSDYNLAMENGVRLSAYKVARESGMSRAQAASLAKNLTVNFNRKGSIATQVGALYAFFNASVQGTARLAEALKGPAGKKIILGGLLFGSLQAIAMSMAGLDDDPPEFVKERNTIIPIGGGKYLMLPMPLGLHIIPNIGRVVTEWMLNGMRDTGKRVTGLLGAATEAFNPIGSAGLSLQTITPTVVDPLAALAENKDWTGRPIARKDFSSLHPTPGHTRAKDTATWFGHVVSKGLNYMSGGTAYKPGMFSPTPDQIDYLAGQVTGGLGREISKVDQAVSSAATGEKMPTYKIPLLGRFYGSAKDEASQGGPYYDNLREIFEHKAEIEGRRRSKEPIGDYLKENPEAKLVLMATMSERQVSELRKRKRDMIASGAKREDVERIDDAITARMRAFNDRVRTAKSTL